MDQWGGLQYVYIYIYIFLLKITCISFYSCIQYMGVVQYSLSQGWVNCRTFADPFGANHFSGIAVILNLSNK